VNVSREGGGWTTLPASTTWGFSALGKLDPSAFRVDDRSFYGTVVTRVIYVE
jgi:hypothetical protein